jgi:hypothetical protein
MAKDKILSVLESISKYDLSNMFYSLTLNYKNIVQGFDYKEFDTNLIREIIDNYDENITTFNLAINNLGRYDENKYKSYYYIVDLIFHTDGMVFTFSSPYLSNREIRVSDVDKLFRIYEEHKKTSKTLYDIVL